MYRNIPIGLDLSASYFLCPRSFFAVMIGFLNNTAAFCNDYRNTDLRSWICMPLTVEIFDRADETVRYCQNRLLGSHSPYPYEAYPEGNRAHLAAESLLFARVVTEGLFGLRAVGLNTLRIQPQLSNKCPEMVLHSIKLFSKAFDIKADASGITVTYNQQNYHTDSKNAVFCFDTCTFTD